MLAKWCRSYLSFIFNLWNIMLNHQKTIRWVVFLCTYVPFQTCDSLESLFVDTLTYLTIHFVVEPNQQYWGNGCVSVCVRLCTCFTCANTKKPIAHNIYHLATLFSVQCPLYKPTSGLAFWTPPDNPQTIFSTFRFVSLFLFDPPAHNLFFYPSARKWWMIRTCKLVIMSYSQSWHTHTNIHTHTRARAHTHT